MNTASEPRRCPACSAEIPATAPQGLCPKCLLLGVASVAESSGLSDVLDPVDLDRTNERRPVPVSARARSSRAQANDARQTPPSVEELTTAFPQLEIIELVGRGGMGFVYKARQPKLDRLVALKILPGHLASEPSFHERFEREARVLAKLQHPLIVSVYDFGEAVAVPPKHHPTGLAPSDNPNPTGLAPVESGLCTTHPIDVSEKVVQRPVNHRDKPGGVALRQEADGTGSPRDSIAGTAPRYFYLMLEYVDGVNLREAMRAGRFTPDQALAIVPQVCEALQYAHSKGVLHRDIKPENILLDTEGRVKIADFGIAKVLGPEIESSSNLFAPGGASESERAVSRLTATGAVLGTPLYMAPEQLLSPNSVDHRADIFSLGVVFYEMLTGELPMGRFAPPSEKSLANQQIDQRIDEVVLRALAKERELRQQSAGEMKTEVETISSQRAAGVPPLPTPLKPVHAMHSAPRSTSRVTAGDSTPSVGAAAFNENSGSSDRRGSQSGTAREPSQGRYGWWALVAVVIGHFLATAPLVGVRAVRSVPGEQMAQRATASWAFIAIPLMLLFFIGGIGVPMWLGWRHLSRQRQAGRREGIIPAMIAAYFVPLLLLDVLLFWLVHVPLDSLRQQMTPNSFAIMTVLAHYAGGVLCLIVDVIILVATWHWVTNTPYSWKRSGIEAARTDSPHIGRTFAGASLIALAVLIVIGWVSYAKLDNHAAHQRSLTEVDKVHQKSPPLANTEPSRPVSAAEAEALRLGLIRVVDEKADVYTFQMPIGLKGDAGEVLVEPHFSALVRFPVPTNYLAFTSKQTGDSRQDRAFIAEYPCDYIACDWTAGTDQPRIMGYMLPPGAYDFRADAETGTLLMETDSTERAKIAADTLTIIRAAALKSAATESDWQQGTQAAHVRFKLVPKAISKLSVPDECLVVLTDKSRSLFTRSGGNFSKHEFVTDANIHELRESIRPPVIVIDREFYEDTPADATAPENLPR